MAIAQRNYKLELKELGLKIIPALLAFSGEYKQQNPPFYQFTGIVWVYKHAQIWLYDYTSVNLLIFFFTLSINTTYTYISKFNWYNFLVYEIIYKISKQTYFLSSRFCYKNLPKAVLEYVVHYLVIVYLITFFMHTVYLHVLSAWLLISIFPINEWNDYWLESPIGT